MPIDWNRVRAEIGAHSTQVANKLNRVRSFAETAAGVAAKPTKLGVFGLSLTALQGAASLLGAQNDGALAVTWHRVPLSGPAAYIVCSLFAGHCEHVGGWWHYGRYGGQRVAYFSNAGSNKPIPLYVEDDPNALMVTVKAELRSRGGQHSKLVSGCTDVIPCEGPREIPSEVAARIWMRLHPFLQARKSRSVILTGPPGTGKTSAAQTVAHWAVNLLGPSTTTLRIVVSDLAEASPAAVDGLLDLLPADVLLIDDLDRFRNTDQLLDLLEHCHGRQRLVIATVNGNLPAAVCRPRRAGDEVFQVDGVGSGLARTLLGATVAQLNDHQLAEVETWPAAFVEELVDRLTTIPGCRPEEEISDLATRVRANAA